MNRVRQPGGSRAWRRLRDKPWITSLRHTGVPALPVLKLLLPLLDGTRDRAALREAVVAALTVRSHPGASRPKLPACQSPWPSHRRAIS